VVLLLVQVSPKGLVPLLALVLVLLLLLEEVLYKQQPGLDTGSRCWCRARCEHANASGAQGCACASALCETR
jgi:hypothetical protein